MCGSHITFASACICGLLSLVSLAQAQKRGDAPRAAAAPISTEPRSTTAAFGDWVLVCQRTEATPPTKVCEVSQSVQVQGQAAPLLQLAISKPKQATDRRLTLVVPSNISLPSTPKIGIGENDPRPITLAWTRCLPGGCFADAGMPDETMKAWRETAAPGQVSVTDGSGRTLNIPISFRGLAQALDASAKE